MKKTMKEKTFSEARYELAKARDELLYQIAKLSGLLGLIRKIPFLEYRSWVKVKINRGVERV